MPTPFQKAVYAALQRVPRGRVTTYQQLAAEVGCRSAQAVGQALKRNPYAPEVPCHRVIASDLTPGGFMGRPACNATRPAVATRLQCCASHCGQARQRCGRVRSIAGRRGGSALRRKLKLLAEEGVLFQAGKLADPRRLFLFRD